MINLSPRARWMLGASVLAVVLIVAFVPITEKLDLAADSNYWQKIVDAAGLSKDVQAKLRHGRPMWRKEHTWYVGWKDTGVGFGGYDKACGARTCAGGTDGSVAGTYGFGAQQVAKVKAALGTKA